MNKKDFNELTEKIFDLCEAALNSKDKEYSRNDDRLHNFKAAGRKRDKNPLDVLLDMQLKHRVSIDDICTDIMNEDKYPTDELLFEKIKDDINYNILAAAMILEMRENARNEKEKEMISKLESVSVVDIRANCPPIGAVMTGGYFPADHHQV